jgi:putative nucleotidyltransferase with HDIG domain
VTAITIALARQMGLDDEQIAQMRRGSLLHDIGKMSIPDEILQKNGPLSDEERRIVEQHPSMAYEMLSSIQFLQPALDIPRYHHEKWNGTGYPYHLKGTEIPLAARIFSVIDVWDALTSDRAYRSALSDQEVKQYIASESGKSFDPRVVDEFFKLDSDLLHPPA